ncbi:beta-lactamase-like protein [Lasiosphaeria miniovina]|uniref:Beta-lactamase-like protein n=1 Tax=Lasiosphaeria miniovina TaxID=1954250 RepID=A0AA40DXN2_9PEZI|nr:beta-lactamase-like protein [Lasiosphaeria miniovina]KAK0717442.1 beta-lactamase-like protein [Lasiosphaeria miniovina]
MMIPLRPQGNAKWQPTARVLLAGQVHQFDTCRMIRPFSGQAFPPKSSRSRGPLCYHSIPTSTILKSSQALYSTASTTPAVQPTIHSVFERVTGTWQYVVADPSTLTAVVIDPVLDFDPVTRAATTGSADSLLSLVKEKGYTIDRILETHAHADHLTAASYLQHRLSQTQGRRPPIGIGKRIGLVQTLFGRRYGVPADECKEDAFDKLLDDDETFEIGNLKAMAMHLPGHTPDHLGYKIGDNVFCGDSLFHADVGTARCDFPGGSANSLFASGRRLLSLPANVKIWTGHDYPPPERKTPMAWMSVQDHRTQNKHLRDGISEDEFVAMRKKRDASLGAPRLLHQSLQMNIRAGNPPKPTAYGDRLLQLPMNFRGAEW